MALLLAPTNVPQEEVLGRVDELLSNVAKAFGTTVDGLKEVKRAKNDARDVAIWGLRTVCRLRLEEVGKVMGVGYSAISHSVVKVKKRMERDERFAKKFRSAVFKT